MIYKKNTQEQKMCKNKIAYKVTITDNLLGFRIYKKIKIPKKLKQIPGNLNEKKN